LKDEAMADWRTKPTSSTQATKSFARGLRRQLTLPEGLLWRALKGGQFHGHKFRKQHPIGPYVLDFYCHELRLAVEVDGGSHSMGDRPVRDEQRDRWLAENGVRCIRLSASMILEDVDDAIRTLESELGLG